ncbi:hypothetical protein JW835_01290 [bacterium]|nr:hypothetical protein [bacterium]
MVDAASLLSPLESRLQKDIEDARLDTFSKIEAAFILSGVKQSDSLEYYKDWYYHLLDKIRGFPFDKFNQAAAAGQVFSYLHTSWLKTYQRESTDLLSIVHNQEYNCVAATILYNLICEDLGWMTEAFETPTHVYTIFSNFTQPITVENTSPLGFDIMKNLHEYSIYLRQYYPENEVYRIGLDRLYAYENSNGRMINNTELLGLLAYNRAYFARNNEDYAIAYELVLLAQSFNIDSRSNVRFEKNLYYIWGKKLFDEERYDEAFSVLADAVYRYPDMSDFVQNTRAAFFQSLNRYWLNRDWQNTKRIIEEIHVLNVLEEKDQNRLYRLLEQWSRHFHRISEKSCLKDVNELREEIKSN